MRLHREALAHRSLYPQTPLHREAFTQSSFAGRCFYTQKLSLARAVTHSSFSTEKPLNRAVSAQWPLHTQRPLHRAAFTHRRCLHKEAFLTHGSFYTEQILHTDVSTHGSLYTEKLLHREYFLHIEAFRTQQPLHTEDFTQRSLYTEELSFPHRSFYTGDLLHTATLHTQKPLQRNTKGSYAQREAFTHRSAQTQAPFHANVFTQRSFYTKEL